MTPELRGMRVAVIGGDLREVEVARLLASRGAEVRVVSLPVSEELEGLSLAATVEDAVRDREVVILPVQGTDEDGFVHVMEGQAKVPFGHSEFACMRSGALLFIGVARPLFKDLAAHYGIRLREIRDRDDFAIFNSIPTAEGAIARAMELMPCTIFGSKAVVIGGGRTGLTLANRLRSWGAETIVVDRSDAARARAYEQGCVALAATELAEVLSEADVVFNTVPALVLPRELLNLTRQDVVILDLASAPGGVDFLAARDLGRFAESLPGLPGRVAPKTAGAIVARVILQVIADENPPPGQP